MAKTRSEVSNQYIGKSIAINQIENKRDINDIPINNRALRAHYGVSNRIESNRKIHQLIESIKFHINDITTFISNNLNGFKVDKKKTNSFPGIYHNIVIKNL